MSIFKMFYIAKNIKKPRKIIKRQARRATYHALKKLW